MKRELMALLSNVFDNGTAIYIIQMYFRNQRDEILDFLLRINMPVAKAFYDLQMEETQIKERKFSEMTEYMVRTSSEQMADIWADSYTDQYTKVVEKKPYMDPEDVALSFDDDLGKTETGHR